MFSRFDTIHARDRQTDGQIDGLVAANTRYSIYSLAHKNYAEIFMVRVYAIGYDDCRRTTVA